MLEKTYTTTVAASTVAALTNIGEQQASHDYCCGCDTHLLGVESITLRVVEVQSETVVYSLCPQCSLAVCCGGAKRRKIEHRALEKVRQLMQLNDMPPGGNA